MRKSPFMPGDVVIVVDNRWKSLRKGQTIRVLECRHRLGRWYVDVDNPRYGPSAYNADGFELYERYNQLQGTYVEPKEPEMYVAYAISPDATIEALHDGYDPEMIGTAQSQDLLKKTIEDHLLANPDNRVAVFKMVTLAEVHKPKPPITYRRF